MVQLRANFSALQWLAGILYPPSVTCVILDIMVYLHAYQSHYKPPALSNVTLAHHRYIDTTLTCLVERQKSINCREV